MRARTNRNRANRPEASHRSGCAAEPCGNATRLSRRASVPQGARRRFARSGAEQAAVGGGPQLLRMLDVRRFEILRILITDRAAAILVVEAEVTGFFSRGGIGVELLQRRRCLI